MFEIIAILKLTKRVFLLSVSIWILETIYFLILEGWHFKATNKLEIEIDNFVNELFKIGFYLMIYFFYLCINFYNKKISHAK